MFGKLAHRMYRHRWMVVGLWLVILAVGIAGASQVGSILGPGDFTQKGSDSARAAAILEHNFHQNGQRVTLVLMHNPTGTVADPGFQSAVAATIGRISAIKSLHIDLIDNPIKTGNRQLISRDRHSVAIMIDSNMKEQDIEGQIDHLRSVVRTPGFQVWVIGTPAANHDYAISSKNDLSKGESITVPILIVILLLVFGTLVAGLLPLILAGFSIVLSLALVFVLGHFVDTSIYVTNVVTVLGLGIGIDYSLFIVYRFREELERWGGNVEMAVVRTMETTGRAVFFSGLTVAIGLSSLILTQLSFMQSMGLGGMLVPFTAVLAAMTLLPAILGLLGTKVNRLRVLPRRFLQTGNQGMWHSLATGIMRRPVLYGTSVLIVMLALIYPATQMAFAFGSFKNAPRVESIEGFLYMKGHFNTAPDPVQVVVQRQGQGTLTQPSQIAALRQLQTELGHDPQAYHVVGPANFIGPTGAIAPVERSMVIGHYLSPNFRDAVIQIVPRQEVGTKPTEELVRRIRTLLANATTGPLKGDVAYVGGAQADYNDFNDAMYSKFPLIVVLVLALTYAFLFFAFRSFFLPLKAVLLNLLSVGASFGMLVLVFQKGIGSSLLGFSPETGIASWVPIFLFAFLFGLSMDYEVFLLSRIREAWLNTGDNVGSVAYGLEKTGRLITSAAAIMVVAFSGFLIGQEIQLKEFGFGMLAAIALDASLIRIVLVPSIMKIMGRWNWWVPSGLNRWSRGGIPVAEGEGAGEKERQPVTA